MEMVSLSIDGKPATVPKGSTILDAARTLGIDIPTLCHHPDLEIQGVCRICVVDIKGSRVLQSACSYPASEGMEVYTNSPRVREARKLNLELLLSRHPQDCLVCIRNGNCELQALSERFGLRDLRFDYKPRRGEIDKTTPSIVRDPAKCVLCRRCISACQGIQEVGALFTSGRGPETTVGPAMNSPLGEAVCVYCGQCIQACPVGAIYEVDDTSKVWKALADPAKHVVVQTAPAIRAAIGEEMGLEPGTLTTGQLVAALRRLGFDKVFDTDFTADLTIMEEGHELLERLQNNDVLPLITSCSPGWIKYIEHYYPDLLPHVSSCKSPQQMFGTLAKTYYAEKSGISPEDICVVSIMPCTAKKFEASRPEMTSSGYTDVDVVLTTRELGRMMREAGLVLDQLPEEDYDEPLGISTGAGVIFGATGGVAEAALRTVYEVVTGEELKNLEFTACRGMDGVKEAAVDLGGKTVRVAIAHGLSNARSVLEKLNKGEDGYTFVEIMCCPGGCVGGGGQPIPSTRETRAVRGSALYMEDEDMGLRKSHENPAVQQLYAEYLGSPLSEKAHHLLHTHYKARGI